MKPAPLVLAASLVANAALFAAILWRPAGLGATAAPGAEASGGSRIVAADPAAPAVETGQAAWTALAGEPAVATAWQTLSAGTPGDLIAHLRAAGFPPHVLRMVAQQLIREQLAGRQRELLAQLPAGEYWKASFNNYWIDPQYRAGQRDLALELRVRLKELLGDDYEPPDLSREGLANLGRRYGSLDPGRLEQLRQIERDYSDLQMQLSSGGGTGVRLPEDNDALKALQAEMRRDIAALLTPAELEEYDRRNSPTAAMLRRRLADIDLAEDEYHAIYGLQKAFDDSYTATYSSGVVLPDTPEFKREREAAQKELDAALLAALGAERAAEYQRAGDYNYQRTLRVAQHLGLPREAAATAYDVQRESQRRAAAIYGDRSLSSEERTAQMTALRDDTSRRLTTVLTADGLAIYKLNGGQWLDRLVPPATPPRR